MSFAQVKRHRILQSEVERIADQRVTDRHFVNPRNAGEEVAQIVQIEVVTCVESQAQLASAFGCRNIGRDGLIAVRGLTKCRSVTR